MVGQATVATVYNVPAKLIKHYEGRNVIVRSSSPAELVASLSRSDLSLLRFMQLTASTEDSSCLESFGPGIPLEIVLTTPVDYHLLYSYANLLDSHPVRVAIPVVLGFSKAVKLAVSLDFAVKLEMEQPDQFLLREVESVLDLYLHRRVVNQPIEPFHTLLLSFYRNEPVSLWEITEKDPSILSYVSVDGNETLSSRFVEQFAAELINDKRECCECEFFNQCRGYFKWPRVDYGCDGVKQVFRALLITARELKEDLASFESMEAQAQP